MLTPYRRPLIVQMLTPYSYLIGIQVIHYLQKLFGCFCISSIQSFFNLIFQNLKGLVFRFLNTITNNFSNSFILCYTRNPLRLKILLNDFYLASGSSYQKSSE